MQNNPSTKPIIKRANFYFGASLLVLILTTVLLLLMLNNQNKVNTLAQRLIDKTEGLHLSEKQLQANIQDILTNVELADISKAIPDEVNTNQITREFDDYFSSRDGAAINNSLNFSSVSEDETTKLSYVDATLSISSDEENFYNFLRFVETSGISQSETRRLMEIRSIDISFNSASSDTLSYRLTVRVYFKSNTPVENE